MKIESIIVPIIIILIVILICALKFYNKKKDETNRTKNSEINNFNLQRIKNDINKNGLPIQNNLSIVLEEKEICHFYCEHAVDCQIKNMVVGQQSSYQGSSASIVRGFGMRSGGSVRQSIRDDVKITTSGSLYLTNKRIIFTASKRSITIPLKSIISVDVYCGYIVIHNSKGERLFGVGDQDNEIKVSSYLFLLILEKLINKNINI